MSRAEYEKEVGYDRSTIVETWIRDGKRYRWGRTRDGVLYIERADDERGRWVPFELHDR